MTDQIKLNNSDLNISSLSITESSISQAESSTSRTTSTRAPSIITPHVRDLIPSEPKRSTKDSLFYYCRYYTTYKAQSTITLRVHLRNKHDILLKDRITAISEVREKIIALYDNL